MAKGWPALNGGVLQPDATHERDANIRVALAGIVTGMDIINSFKPAVTIRQLESAGVLPAHSTCLHQLITKGLVQDVGGMS